MTEREGERRSRAHRGSKVIRLVSATAYKQQNTQLYRYHTSEMRSFEGSEFTSSVDRMYGECQNGSVYSTSIDVTYFSFASCHVNIDHHDTPHVTSPTRPSSRFSAFNIEKLGMGLGTRLIAAYNLLYSTYSTVQLCVAALRNCYHKYTTSRHAYNHMASCSCVNTFTSCCKVAIPHCIQQTASACNARLRARFFVCLNLSLGGPH